VPVDRDGGGAAGLKAILARLLAGGGIILFPEGTRTRDGRLQPRAPASGCGGQIRRAGCAVRVFGTFEAFGEITNSAATPHRGEIWRADAL